VIADADALLRGEGRHAVGGGRLPWVAIVAIVVAAGFAYGAVMGLYQLRPLQALYSGLKVPLLLFVATIVCLPNFFVVNSVLGLRDDLAAAVRGILSAQGTMAICLLGLAPITAFIYFSDIEYQTAKVANGLMFALASVAGQVTLARHYRPLLAKDRRHMVGLVGWLLLYIFVAVQFAWVLRPFIGRPDMDVTFFREGAWGNAYIEVLRAIQDVLGDIGD
jgi:hypothetical protein